MTKRQIRATEMKTWLRGPGLSMQLRLCAPTGRMLSLKGVLFLTHHDFPPYVVAGVSLLETDNFFFFLWRKRFLVRAFVHPKMINTQ